MVVQVCAFEGPSPCFDDLDTTLKYGVICTPSQCYSYARCAHPPPPYPSRFLSTGLSAFFRAILLKGGRAGRRHPGQ